MTAFLPVAAAIWVASTASYAWAAFTLLPYADASERTLYWAVGAAIGCVIGGRIP